LPKANQHWTENSGAHRATHNPGVERQSVKRWVGEFAIWQVAG
jgi:hypothetical protein